jgi:hypothetical protein
MYAEFVQQCSSGEDSGMYAEFVQQCSSGEDWYVCRVCTTMLRIKQLTNLFKHEHPVFLWWRATPVTVGWFAGSTLKNYSK